MTQVEERTTSRREPSKSRGLPLSFASMFIHQSDSAITQMFRFMLVGALATVADMGTLYILHHIVGWDYKLAATFGFTLGLTVSYSISVRWVFTARNISNRTLEFVLFCAIGVIGLGLTLAIMQGCVECLHTSVMWGKVVATVIVFAWNFGARRLIMFRQVKVRT